MNLNTPAWSGLRQGNGQVGSPMSDKGGATLGFYWRLPSLLLLLRLHMPKSCSGYKIVVDFWLGQSARYEYEYCTHTRTVLVFVHSYCTRTRTRTRARIVLVLVCNEVTSILLYLRIKVDSRQSIEPLVWWTSGGTHIPEITCSILVIIFPTSSHKRR